jgi:copper(I)-binding protein
MKFHYLVSLLFAATFFIGCSQDNSKEPSLIISDAYINIPLEGQIMSAGYFKFTNNSQSNLRITGVSCLNLDVSIHKTLIAKDGKMKMRRVFEIEVKPGDSHFFQPGSDHLMIKGLRKEIIEGDEVNCILVLGDISTPVRFLLK